MDYSTSLDEEDDLFEDFQEQTTTSATPEEELETTLSEFADLDFSTSQTPEGDVFGGITTSTLASLFSTSEEPAEDIETTDDSQAIQFQSTNSPQYSTPTTTMIPADDAARSSSSLNSEPLTTQMLASFNNQPDLNPGFVSIASEQSEDDCLFAPCLQVRLPSSHGSSSNGEETYHDDDAEDDSVWASLLTTSAAPLFEETQVPTPAATQFTISAIYRNALVPTTPPPAPNQRDDSNHGSKTWIILVVAVVGALAGFAIFLFCKPNKSSHNASERNKSASVAAVLSGDESREPLDDKGAADQQLVEEPEPRSDFSLGLSLLLEEQNEVMLKIVNDCA